MYFFTEKPYKSCTQHHREKIIHENPCSTHSARKARVGESVGLWKLYVGILSSCQPAAAAATLSNIVDDKLHLKNNI